MISPHGGAPQLLDGFRVLAQGTQVTRGSRKRRQRRRPGFVLPQQAADAHVQRCRRQLAPQYGVETNGQLSGGLVQQSKVWRLGQSKESRCRTVRSYLQASILAKADIHGWLRRKTGSV